MGPSNGRRDASFERSTVTIRRRTALCCDVRPVERLSHWTC